MEVWTKIIGLAAPTVSAVSTYFAWKCKKSVSEIHVMINSRMDAWMKAATEAALLKGKTEADAIQLIHVADIASKIVLETAVGKAKDVRVLAAGKAQDVVAVAEDKAKGVVVIAKGVATDVLATAVDVAKKL